MDTDEIISGLDVGASGISCAIGRVDERNRIKVIGIGTSPSLGMENGVVVDVPLLSSSIESAILEAEEVSETEIESVFIAIGQTNFRGVKGHGVVSIPGAGREITKKDVNRVIEVARVVTMRSSAEPVEEIVQEFIVDGQGGIINPVGMYGFKLEAEVYMVTGTLSTFSKTIIECVKNLGFEVEGTALKPLAAAEAVLTKSEKKLGILLVDLGAETTSVAVYVNGNAAGAKILAIGANQVTVDIAGKFHIPMPVAEQLKRTYGHALSSSVGEKEEVHIPNEEGLEKKRISKRSLAQVVQDRLETTFSLIRREIEDTKFPRGIGESMVLTGGGASLKGINELARQKFGLPIRIGKPDGRIEGWGKVINNPAYSTLFGLLPTGLNRRQLKAVKDLGWQSPLAKLRKWFRDFF